MANQLALRPTYWASISGGKDSLYMLKLILENLDKYPLTGVVHFELDIDYPFIKDVIDYMEAECKKVGIQFVRIKPRQTWEQLYDKYGFPSGKRRWCNDKYKLDAQKQLVQFMKSQGYNTQFYIGYCYDEIKRYGKRTKLKLNERYPLVENKILETSILEWAKTVPIFNDYYIYNRRCGCMYCPLASYQTLAYLYKYYPEKFYYMIDKIRKTESELSKKLGRSYAIRSSNARYNADYTEWIIKKKWLRKLEKLAKKPKSLI